MRVPSPARAIQVTGWLAGWWLLWRLPAPAPPVAGTEQTDAVSVIIPARNEERSLPRLLRSLAAQSATAAEVIVVDDHSSDATAALAAAAGATVVRSQPLPPGWTGKTWACHQGAAQAGGPLLCFVDADVSLAPDALARLGHEHARRPGLVSVQPFHITERPYEALSAVCNIVELMGTGAFSAPPRRPGAMAFGPCLLINAPAYRRTGGHAHPDVRKLVAEDVGLARRARAEGIAVSLFAGRDVVKFRMYPDGPRQLVEGWTKMLAYGARHAPAPITLAVGAWVTAGLLGAGDAARALLGPSPLGPSPLGPSPLGSSQAARRSPRGAAGRAVLGYAAWGGQRWWMQRRVGRFGTLAVLAWPAPLVAFVGLFGRSVLSRATGRAPRWRGRVAPRA